MGERIVFTVWAYKQYYDSERDLVEPLFEKIEEAKQFIERRAKGEYEYMQMQPERYDIDGKMVGRWLTEGTEQIYEYTDQGHITLAGNWDGGWGRYAIVPTKLKL